MPKGSARTSCLSSLPSLLRSHFHPSFRPRRSLYDRTLSPVPRATHTTTHYTRTGRPSTWVHPSTRLPPRPRSTMLHHQQHASQPGPSSTGAAQPFPFTNGRPSLGSQMPGSSHFNSGGTTSRGGTFNSPYSPYLNPDTLQSRYNPVTGKPDPSIHHPGSSNSTAMGPGTSAFASFAANGFGFGKRNQPPSPPPPSPSSSSSRNQPPSSATPDSLFGSPSSQTSSEDLSNSSSSSSGFAKPLVRKGGSRLDRERASTHSEMIRSTAPTPGSASIPNGSDEFWKFQANIWMFGAAMVGVGVAVVVASGEERVWEKGIGKGSVVVKG